MLTKKKVLQLALTLFKSGDTELIHDRSLLAEQGLGAEDQRRIEEIVLIVHELCQNYSYAQSREFILEMEGKSAAYLQMKTKMESAPTRKAQRLESLYASIRNAATGQGMASMSAIVRDDQHSLVGKLGSLVLGLSLPIE